MTSDQDATNSQDGNTAGSVTSDQASGNEHLEESPTYRQLGEEGDPFSQGQPGFTAPDDAEFGGAPGSILSDPDSPGANPDALVEGNIVADERDLDPEDDR